MSHQFCDFQHFLVNFPVKVICFILITLVQYTSRGKSECELFLLLVCTNSSLCNDNTKLCLALKQFLSVILIYNVLSLNSQNARDSFLFKNKIQLAFSRQIWHKSKTNKKKKARHFCKKDYSVKHFTSVLNKAREIPKNKGKNPDKMCQLIFQKMYP